MGPLSAAAGARAVPGWKPPEILYSPHSGISIFYHEPEGSSEMPHRLLFLGYFCTLHPAGGRKRQPGEPIPIKLPDTPGTPVPT